MSISLKNRLGSCAHGAARFFTGAGLPLFLASAAVVYEAFILAVLFAPVGSGPWGAFSEQFKLWCFGYNQRTGGLEWTEVFVMQFEPLFVLGIALLVSRKSLFSLRSLAAWKAHRSSILGGFAFSVLPLMVLFLLGTPTSAIERELPFPGKRIRTELTPPAFELTDQLGNPFDLEELKGDVVIVTGIYALCGSTCPLILIELKVLLEELSPEERERAHIVAITLNPENETREDMYKFIEAYGFEYSDFKYLNGDPAHVRQTLKKLQFSRTENPEYGIIDHSNLFVLIDADGRIAYRLTLDDRHQSWLRAALKELAVEARQNAEALAKL